MTNFLKSIVCYLKGHNFEHSCGHIHAHTSMGSDCFECSRCRRVVIGYRDCGFDIEVDRLNSDIITRIIL